MAFLGSAVFMKPYFGYYYFSALRHETDSFHLRFGRGNQISPRGIDGRCVSLMPIERKNSLRFSAATERNDAIMIFVD